MERSIKKLILIKMILLVSVTICISCSTMKHNIQKNNKQTDKTISLLLKKYGNVFYLNSTHFTFSTVWSYNKDSIEIYKLANGKLRLQQKYSATSIYNIKQLSKEELFDLDQCMELDGDNFGYSIERGVEIEKYDLPIAIKCFTKINHKSDFLKKVAEDINTYKIWNVQYR